MPTATPLDSILDQPTSVEFIGDTAFVMTLDGEIWRIDDVSRPPYSASALSRNAAVLPDITSL